MFLACFVLPLSLFGLGGGGGIAGIYVEILPILTLIRDKDFFMADVLGLNQKLTSRRISTVGVLVCLLRERIGHPI